MRTELKENEEILYKAKKHWFVLLPVIILFLFSFAFVTVAPFVPVIFALILIYSIISRQKNIWIVTNQRLIDEKGVLSINSKENSLDKINNVTYGKPLIGRIFNYGSLKIQTAAEMGATKHSVIKNPKEFKDAIIHAQENYSNHQMNRQVEQAADAMKNNQNNSIYDELEKLNSLKEQGVLTEEEFSEQKRKILNQ